MALQKISLLGLFCLLSHNLIAATDLSAIEEQERAQIISELSYGLQAKENCSAQLIWDDAGSGADLDGYFFLPQVKNSEYMIGGHASQKRRSKYHCVTTLSEATDNPENTPRLMVAPADWKQVWKDSGSGATRDGSFWSAIPPDNNYVCIGSVAQLNHNAKPNLANYRCVHKSLTDKIVSKNILWSDKGSGADSQLTIFSLPTTTSFVAIASRATEAEVYDLKKDARNVPDMKKVEEILAQRMAPIKADIEAKTKALQEEKAAAEKAEAEKIAAAKKAKKLEEEKKLAAAAEKKKQEEAQAIKDQQALSEKQEEQAKQEAAEAEKLKQEQQERIAKAMVEKEAAEKAKQMAEKEKENTIEIQKEQPVEVQETESVEQNAIAKTDEAPVKTSKGESKGLNDLLMFFMKVLGMMIGGVIVFMIAFKILFGKKSSD